MSEPAYDYELEADIDRLNDLSVPELIEWIFLFRAELAEAKEEVEAAKEEVEAAKDWARAALIGDGEAALKAASRLDQITAARKENSGD